MNFFWHVREKQDGLYTGCMGCFGENEYPGASQQKSFAVCNKLHDLSMNMMCSKPWT